MGSERAYDLTLVYNPSDARVVEELARRLRDEQFGLRVFAKGDLLPGASWIKEVEYAISHSGAVAVFFGPIGLESWQDQEAQLGLFHAVLNERPIIPVLLAGASKQEIGGFLKLRTCVDLATEGLGRLVQAVTGELPKWAGEAELGPELRRRLTVYRVVRRDLIDFSVERGRHEHFFGREDVFAEIDEQLRARASGWVVVSGGPGLGKSALLERWLTLREQAGLPTVYHFLRRGHQNWAEPDPARANLSAQIEYMFPEQRDPDAEPRERLEQLLSRVSPVLAERGQQLVLLVDGLDEAMAFGKENPVPRIFPLELPTSVFVVVASRPKYPHLNWFMQRTGAVHGIDLDERSRSNKEAVRKYWASLGPKMNPALPPELERAAVEHAHGNLLHAVKLRELWTRPGAMRSIGDVPAGFEGMLEELWARIGELPEPDIERAEDGLGLLCAARESLPLHVLEELLGWREGHGERKFLPCVREMLLEEHWHGYPAYRPFHEGLRELVQRKLPKAAKRNDCRLAAFAAWPLEGDAFRRGYALQHRVAHQLAAGQVLEAAASCRDVGYLTAKTCERGVAEVEREVRMAAREQEPKARRFLETLGLALGACSHWVSEAPEALPNLLHDRLLSFASHVHGELVWPTQLPRNGLRLRHPLQKGSLARTLLGHQDRVNALAILPDGRIVSASDDKTLRVWDLDSGESLVLEGHQEGVLALAVLPDGRIVSASEDKTLRVWDLDSGHSRVLEGHQGWVNALAVLPDGCIVSASDDNNLRVWDLDSGHTFVLEGHQGWVSAVAVLSDGRIVSASNDKTLRVWDLDFGHSHVLEGHQDLVTALALLPDGRIVSASHDKTLRVWDLDFGHSRVLERHQDSVGALAVLPDGRIISASRDSSRDKTLRVWDLDAGQSRVLEGHRSSVIAQVFLPDSRLVSASSECALRVWDLDSSQARVLEGHRGMVRALAVLPDGRIVSSASHEGGTLRVWDLDSGQSRFLKGHRTSVNALAVLSDGRIVSASDDKTLRVWDLDSGHSRVLKGHQGSVSAVAVLPDGRIISASDDKTLRVWDLDSGHSRVLEGRQSWVRALTVLPDGRRLVSASNDSTLRVWDLDAGQVITTVYGEAPFSLIMAVDEHVIVAGDELGNVWFLEFPRAGAETDTSK